MNNGIKYFKYCLVLSLQFQTKNINLSHFHLNLITQKVRFTPIVLCPESDIQ